MSEQNLRPGGSTYDTDRVFVLRFWIERAAAPNAAAVWRAKVSNLSTGEEKHANDVDGALACVRSAMTLPPP
jgi:hypothetical protein